MKSLTCAFTIMLFGALFVLSGCSDPASDTQDDLDTWLEEIRVATASFHDIDNAVAAGWANDISGCVEHPEEGGMGHHYARMEFFDGRTNYLEPQVLLYEPLEGGGFAFLGVEYIVPFEVRPADADPPEILGQHYHQNHEIGIWALHVWTERENDKGVFYDWNPSVSCEYAVDEE